MTTSGGTGRTRRRLRRWAAGAMLVLVALAAIQLALAARAANEGRSGLDAAVAAARDQDLAQVKRELADAASDLRSARGHIRGAGPLVWLARVTPLLRAQVGAVDAVLAAAQETADAGLALVPVAAAAQAGDSAPGASRVVAALSEGAPQLHEAVSRLVSAQERVDRYERYRLLGPVRTAQRETSRRLAEVAGQAARAEKALVVLLELAGAHGPRRFLLLSQNPDEPRPTGGFIGTYGVLTSTHGEFELADYRDIYDWLSAHPEAVVPTDRLPFIFTYTSHPQSLGNVNATPDWPASARLAHELWRAGGGQDVDGVLTYLPGLVARLLEPLGPVRVPSYGETITAANVDARLQFHTHSEAVRGLPSGVRKAFIGDLAEVVLERLTTLPADQLPDVARALSAGIAAGEAAVWSTRPEVQSALSDLRWDGAFRGVDGDVFVDAEFAFASKNGRGIRRTFDHVARLRPDGSGVSETRLRIENTQPYEAGYNLGTKSYLTLYGPRGATLAAESDPPNLLETPLEGHPVAGWIRDAPPLGSTDVTVVWEAPRLVIPREDGAWEYRLRWVPVPGHRGDVLRLRVVLPPGWEWDGPAPPREVRLFGVYDGRWKLTQRNR